MKANEKTAGWKRAAWLVSKCDKMSRKTKLAFYRELRSLGVLPEEATFFLIGWEICKVWEHRFDKNPAVIRLFEESIGIERRHGMADGWPEGKGPKRHQAIDRKLAKMRADNRVDTLRKFGEHEMADLCFSDHEKFSKTFRAGRDYFYREFRPEWSDKEMEKRIRAIRKETGRKAA